MVTPSGFASAVQILAPAREGQDRVLTTGAVQFVVELQRRFNALRLELLAARAEHQKRLNAGEKPDFLQETQTIRESEWIVAPIPADLLDRRVEITGPVDRKMIINVLNSGAKVFMADFEDSHTPTWANQIDGQLNLMDAVRRTITYSDPPPQRSTSSGNGFTKMPAYKTAARSTCLYAIKSSKKNCARPSRPETPRDWLPMKNPRSLCAT